MRFLSISLFVVILGANAFPASPDDAVTRRVMVPVSAVLSAYDGGSVSLRGMYTRDAVVMDRTAPFRWDGAGSGATWLEAMRVQLKFWNLTGFRAVSTHVDRLDIQGSSARVVLPVAVSGTIGTRHYGGSGRFTFVLQKVGNTWLISGQSWSDQQPLSSGRYQLDPT